jgi:hypothetical protein
VVIVYAWTLLRDRPAGLALLTAAWGLADAEGPAIWLADHAGMHTPWLSSMPLYGGLLLGALLSWALLRAPGGEPDDDAHGRAGPGDSRR